MTKDEILRRYPKSVTLTDGKKIELRAMTAADRDAILEFARGLPEEDLLVRRTDLTEPANVDEWVGNLGRGLATSLLAYDGATLVGYATVHVNPARWTRRVGEIRVNAGPGYRSKGLGRNLTGQIFDIARGLGLKKLMASMTVDQAGAQAAFRRLGFVPEAVLADYVEDRSGVSRDMVIMCYDIDGLTELMDEPLRV